MKRRTRFFVAGAALTGAFSVAAPTAIAMAESRPDLAPSAGSTPRALAPSAGVTARDVAMTVRAPTESVTVSPGDTLSVIGAQTSRSWEQLASYNHIPNPNLIEVGQVISIPPQSYQPESSASSYSTSSYPTQSESTRTSSYSPSGSSTGSVAAASSSPSSSNGGIWSCIASHESGGNPSTDTGNGYYGAFQFSESTWQSLGGTGLPSDASYSQQLAMAQKLQSEAGWGQWPVTSGECGA